MGTVSGIQGSRGVFIMGITIRSKHRDRKYQKAGDFTIRGNRVKSGYIHKVRVETVEVCTRQTVSVTLLV